MYPMLRDRTLAIRVALKWPSVVARNLTRKLNLISKVSSEGESTGCHMCTSLAVASPQSLRLTQKCLQHPFYLAQTVGQGTGSWRKGHISHQTYSFGQKPCPFCDNHSAELSHFEHFISCHTSFASSEFIVELLVRESTNIFVDYMPSISCILYPDDPPFCLLLNLHPAPVVYMYIDLMQYLI